MNIIIAKCTLPQLLYGEIVACYYYQICTYQSSKKKGGCIFRAAIIPDYEER